MPPPNLGDNFAKTHEAGTLSYDVYCGLSCQTISVSMSILVEKLTTLVKNFDLRQEMGKSGKERARTQFDWRVIYTQYQTLYAQLHTLRHSAPPQLHSSPRVAANRLDPFYSFRHYPTALIQPETRVFLQANKTTNYSALIKNPLFNYATQVLPSEMIVKQILANLTTELSINDLSQQSGITLGDTVLAVAVLAKMDFVRLV